MIALVELHEGLFHVTHHTLVDILAEKIPSHVFQLLPELIVLSLDSAFVNIVSIGNLLMPLS